MSRVHVGRARVLYSGSSSTASLSSASRRLSSNFVLVDGAAEEAAVDERVDRDDLAALRPRGGRQHDRRLALVAADLERGGARSSRSRAVSNSSFACSSVSHPGMVDATSQTASKSRAGRSLMCSSLTLDGRDGREYRRRI